jgi:hypothetical protein
VWVRSALHVYVEEECGVVGGGGGGSAMLIHCGGSQTWKIHVEGRARQC